MPKKKGGKKGAKIIDGVATNEMTREQLMGHVKRMQTELDREREERNFFMLEREKLYALWNITVEQLVEAKHDARLSEVRMDDNEHDREKEMHTYKQKMRFLLTEQSRRVALVRLRNLHQMKDLQDSSHQVQDTLHKTIEHKNREISGHKTSLQKIVRKLQQDNVAHVSKLRSDFCSDLHRMEATFLKMMHEGEKTQQILETQEIRRTNQEKSEHIRDLMDLHGKQLREMKDYFHEITTNNFAVISALQEELVLLREKEQELRDEIAKGKKAYKELESSILKGKEEAEKKFREDRKNAEKIKRQLEQCDKRFRRSEKYVRVLEVTNEALIQKGEMVHRERDKLKEAVSQSILEMQRKSNMHRLILESKLRALTSQPQSQSQRKAEDSQEGSEGGDGDHQHDQMISPLLSSPPSVEREVQSPQDDGQDIPEENAQDRARSQ